MIGKLPEELFLCPLHHPDGDMTQNIVSNPIENNVEKDQSSKDIQSADKTEEDSKSVLSEGVAQSPQQIRQEGDSDDETATSMEARHFAVCGNQYFKIVDVEKLGNCQILAIIEAMKHHDPSYSTSMLDLRSQVTEWILANRSTGLLDFFTAETDEEREGLLVDFAESFRRDGVWGSDLTLRAMSVLLAKDVVVFEAEVAAEDQKVKGEKIMKVRPRISWDLDEKVSSINGSDGEQVNYFSKLCILFTSLPRPQRYDHNGHYLCLLPQKPEDNQSLLQAIEEADFSALGKGKRRGSVITFGEFDNQGVLLCRAIQDASSKFSLRQGQRIELPSKGKLCLYPYQDVRCRSPAERISASSQEARDLIVSSFVVPSKGKRNDPYVVVTNTRGSFWRLSPPNKWMECIATPLSATPDPSVLKESNEKATQMMKLLEAEKAKESQSQLETYPSSLPATRSRKPVLRYGKGEELKTPQKRKPTNSNKKTPPAKKSARSAKKANTRPKVKGASGAHNNKTAPPVLPASSQSLATQLDESSDEDSESDGVDIDMTSSEFTSSPPSAIKEKSLHMSLDSQQTTVSSSSNQASTKASDPHSKILPSKHSSASSQAVNIGSPPPSKLKSP